MRERACSFASVAFIVLINAAPLPAHSLEGTVRLVCELQKTQTESRHVAPSEWSRVVLGESQLERVDVTVVTSKDQMTISGVGSEINFSLSSVSGDRIISQGSSWSFARTAYKGVVQIWDHLIVEGPRRSPGMFFYTHMEGLRKTSQAGPSNGQKDLDQKKGSLRETQITGKCRY